MWYCNGWGLEPQSKGEGFKSSLLEPMILKLGSLVWASLAMSSMFVFNLSHLA
jgi:hypothetical protein